MAHPAPEPWVIKLWELFSKDFVEKKILPPIFLQTVYEVGWRFWDLLDEYIQVSDQEGIRKIFVFVHWLYDRRDKDPENFDAIALAFIEHLMDEEPRARVTQQHMAPEIFYACFGLFTEYSLKPVQRDNVNYLLKAYRYDKKLREEMGESTPLHLSDRISWRNWLAENYKTAKEAWLVYPRIHSGKPRIAYNDAVEEAMCFGWIDSINRSLDADHGMQRFTPRRKKSPYSQTNIERIRRLLKQGKIMPELVKELEDVAAQDFVFPSDIMEALQANQQAWEHFQQYSGAYQRIRIAYIDQGRGRPGEFEKRSANFLKKTERNKQFGFGIEAYY